MEDMRIEELGAFVWKSIEEINPSLPEQERVTCFDLDLEDDGMYYAVVPHRGDGTHKLLRFSLAQLSQSGPSIDGSCLICDIRDPDGWVECDGTDEAKGSIQ